MSSNGPKALVSPAANVNQAALASASLTLSRIDHALSDASERFEKSVEREIQTYKAYRRQCDELLSRRTSVIQELSASNSRYAALLDIRTDFDIPAVLLRHDGVLCSLKPVPKHLAQSLAARAVKQSTVNDQQQQPLRILRPKRLAADADLALAVAPAPPNMRLNTSIRQQQQQQKQLQTMKTDVVTKDHYWVFDYTDHTALYTLRCPSVTCNNPVFSKHPLRQERAERHFENCGVEFKNTDDLWYPAAKVGR
ncbi:uncharacterized protein PG998_012208 [Apiospora kogelbergensis]|uniref:uncharacterized protein n=1 Tax=Apiospora kogelbergensis TaxID=1337665 RepID=UPI00313266A9